MSPAQRRNPPGAGPRSRALVAAALAAAFGAAPAAAQDEGSGARAAPFEGRGRLVCLLEEMKERHGLELPPLHAHLVGFRVDDGPGRPPRYVTILRTKSSEALFSDPRFQGRDLRLLGRLFSEGALLEVAHIQGWRDGALVELHYWCDVCRIRESVPGPCSCCQDPVEFRETPVEPRK
jgi:hypothetical protein